MTAKNTLAFPINPALEYTITQNEKNIYTSDKIQFKTAEKEKEWAQTQSKECTKCKETLPLTYFSGNTMGRDHFDQNGYRLRRPDCRKCNKEQSSGKNEAKKIAKQLGLPDKAPEGTKCQICNKTKNIVFDHDHKTKTQRGWLCDPCNRSIGVLGDNVTSILTVVNYLNSSEKLDLYIDEHGNVCVKPSDSS